MGVGFCRPCARQQEVYFAMGELTHEDGRNLRGKPLADVEARKGRDDVEHRVSRSLGRSSESVLERVMNLGEVRIEMRIPQSAWFPRDLCFPHS